MNQEKKSKIKDIAIILLMYLAMALTLCIFNLHTSNKILLARTATLEKERFLNEFQVQNHSE